MEYLPLVDYDYAKLILGVALVSLGVIVPIALYVGICNYHSQGRISDNGAGLASISLIVGLIGFVFTGAHMIALNNDQLHKAESEHLVAVQHNVSVKYQVEPQDVDYRNPHSRFASGYGVYTLNLRDGRTSHTVNMEFDETGEPYIIVDLNEGVTQEWVESMMR